MHRLTLLFIIVLVFNGPSILNAQNREKDRPNVLLIISDDLRNELACYGVRNMITPHIDRIAEEGTLFRRAYVQQAVCAASRASFLTGLRPDATGSDYPYSIYTVEELLQKDRPSFLRHFMNEGYYVRGLGKIHHGYKEDYSEPSFDSDAPKYYYPANNMLTGQDRPTFESADVDDTAYADGANTKEALKTLERMSRLEQPFFLAVGYYKPHLPWCAPKKYFDLYNTKDIPLAPNKYLPENAPHYARGGSNVAKYKPPHDGDGGLIPDERARDFKHAYSACVTYIDAQVGKLMEELNALGLKEKTIVVLISDHGWHLGEQGMWGKQSNFEHGTRAPMIISAPGFSSAQITDALVEYVDLFPTLCELTGVSTPEYLEGTSVVPLLKSPEISWKKAAFSQYPRGYPKAEFEGYAIRTDRYRYVEWREPDGQIKGVELYDHVSDPLESFNYANSPEHNEVAGILRKQLRAGWKAALPEGIENRSSNPEAPEFVPWGPEAKFGPYAKQKKTPAKR